MTFPYQAVKTAGDDVVVIVARCWLFLVVFFQVCVAVASVADVVVGEGIVEAVVEWRSSVVVVTDHRIPHRFESFIGSTADRIILKPPFFHQQTIGRVVVPITDVAGVVVVKSTVCEFELIGWNLELNFVVSIQLLAFATLGNFVFEVVGQEVMVITSVALY